MFLETLTLLAFMNTADPSYSHIYSSGVKDGDEFLFHAPPSYQAPLLFIEKPFKCNFGTIEMGHYLVKPTQDEKKILLMTSGCTVEFDIIENTIVSDYKEIPIAILDYEKDRLILTYQIDNIRKTAILRLQEN